MNTHKQKINDQKWQKLTKYGVIFFVAVLLDMDSHSVFMYC